MGQIITGPQKRRNPLDDFPVVNDERLQISLGLLADQWNDHIRGMIYRTYNDDEILGIYRAMRESGIYQHGGKSKVRREVVRFPNGYVYEFCRAVFEPEYGEKWITKRAVLQNELIRPWLLITIK